MQKEVIEATTSKDKFLHDISVLIVTFNLSDAIRRVAKNYENFLSHFKAHRINIINIPKWLEDCNNIQIKDRNKNSGWKTIRNNSIHISKELTEDPDIILLMTLPSKKTMQELENLRNNSSKSTKIIYFLHSLGAHEFEQEKNLISRPWREYYMRSINTQENALSKSDYIFVASNAYVDIISSKYPEILDKIRTTPLFTEFKQIEIPPSNPKKLLAVGRLEPGKAYINLLNAISIVKRTIPDISLKIAGSGSQYEDFKNIISSKKLQSNVLLLGQVMDPNDLTTLYKDSGIFIHPSLHESFGLALLDAIRFKTPIICNLTRSSKEILGEPEVLVNTGEPELLADKIIDTIRNYNKYKTISKRLFEKSRDRFSKASIYPSLLNEFKEIVDNKTIRNPTHIRQTKSTIGKAKKILILTNDFKPARGGIGKSVWSQYEALTNKGLQLMVAVKHQNYYKVFYRNTWSMFQNLDSIRRILGKIDIVHIHSLAFTNKLNQIKTLFDSPMIYTNHLAVHSENKIEKRLRQINIKKCDRVIELSYEGLTLSKEKLDIDFKKFDVVPNCLIKNQERKISIKNLIRFNRTFKINKKLKSNNQKVLLFAGRIVKEKGIFDLAQAFLTLCKINSRYRLVVVGNAELGSKDKIKMKELLHDIEDKVIFVPWANQETLNIYYQVADIVIIPGNAHSFCLVAIEAMRLKKPVIISNVPGPSELFVRYNLAIGIAPDQPSEIVRAVRQCDINPEMVSTMVEKAYEEIHTRYSPDIVADQLIEVYNRLT